MVIRRYVRTASRWPFLITDIIYILCCSTGISSLSVFLYLLVVLFRCPLILSRSMGVVYIYSQFYLFSPPHLLCSHAKLKFEDNITGSYVI